MKKQSLQVLSALALLGTLTAPVQAQTVRYTPPAATASVLSLEALPPSLAIGEADPSRRPARRVQMCDPAKSTCRNISIPPKVGKLNQIIQQPFVPDDKTNGSFLAFADKWISLCYVAANSIRSTCTPVVQTANLLDFDVELAVPPSASRRTAGAKPMLVFTSRRAAPLSAHTQYVTQAFRGARQPCNVAG